MTTQNASGDRSSNMQPRRIPRPAPLFQPLAPAATEPLGTPDSSAEEPDSHPVSSGPAHDNTVRSLDSVPAPQPKRSVPDDENATVERYSSVMGASGPLPPIGASTQEVEHLLTDLERNPSPEEPKPASNKGSIVPPLLPRAASLSPPEPRHSVAARAASSIPPTRGPNTPRSGSPLAPAPEPADPPTLEMDLFLGLIKVDDSATEFARVDADKRYVHPSAHLKQFVHLGRSVQESKTDVTLKERYKDARSFAIAELLMRGEDLLLEPIEEEDLSRMLTLTESPIPKDRKRAKRLAQIRAQVQKHLEWRRAAVLRNQKNGIQQAAAAQQPGQPDASAPPPANAPAGGGAAAPPPPAQPRVSFGKHVLTFLGKFRKTFSIIVPVFILAITAALLKLGWEGVIRLDDVIKKSGNETENAKPPLLATKIETSLTSSQADNVIIETAQRLGELEDSCLLVPPERVSSKGNSNELTCKVMKPITVPSPSGHGSPVSMIQLCGCRTP